MLELELFGSGKKVEQDLGAIGGVADPVLSLCRGTQSVRVDFACAAWDGWVRSWFHLN